MTKREIYAAKGIEFKNGKIYHEEFGFIPELLIDGNAKIGKGVYHFSTLPTNQIFHVVINNKSYDIKGTCPCFCAGCYATKGNYRFSSTIKSLAIRTWLVLNDIEFVKNAITAQIEADNVQFLRIHASGDFVNDQYIEMWQEVAKECNNTIFWTYTKNKKAETAFDSIDNANIVKSVIKGKGFNFGHCDYILSVYEYLKEQGKKVYICKCGIDKNQHCTNCKSCSTNEYVLFIEHSTEYKAEADPLFPVLKAIIEAQEEQ